MLSAGDMARLGSGRLVKICSVSDCVAECIWFDHRGNIHTRDYDLSALRPFWLASSPRSLWPEINEMPDEIVAAQERRALARREERNRRRLEKSRKSRPSQKIKRVLLSQA